MISVKVAEKNDYERYISEALRWGTKYDLKENSFLFYSTVNEVIYGIGFLRLFDDYALFENVAFNPENQFDMMGYLLGTSMLNFIERRGITKVYSNNLGLDNFLKMIKFKKIDSEEDYIPDKLKDEENIYFVDLTNYFKCTCKK